MSDFYTFPDKAQAVKAEKYLSDLAGVPIVGKVAESAKPKPKNCNTERWAEPLERPDKKYFFQRPPAESAFFPTQPGPPPVYESDFLITFEAKIEPFDPAWLPAPEP